MSYKLRIPEGIRTQIRDLVRQLRPEVIAEWTRRMEALCDNPRLATPLRSAVLHDAFNYSFQIESHIFVYGLDINNNERAIDILDFKHADVM